MRDIEINLNYKRKSKIIIKLTIKLGLNWDS